MRSTERHYDALRGDHYHILKVHVILPLSPMDYLQEAFISNLDSPRRRRMKETSLKIPTTLTAIDNLYNEIDTTCPKLSKGHDDAFVNHAEEDYGL